MFSKKERILKKLNPTLLKMTPKLSGDAGSFIDLDSEDSLEDGAKKLMMRFLRNQDIYGQNKRSVGQNEAEVTISSAKYNENEEICELITERLSLPFVKKEENETSNRPGKRLQTLKMELQEKISAKWEEEYKKRVSENKSIEKNHKEKKKKSHKNSGSESESDDGEDIDEKFDEVENCSDKDDEADDESDDKEENESASILHEDEQSDKSNHCESEETAFEKNNEDDENEACSLVPAYQPGGGLLYGGSELTQVEEGLPQNLLSPSLGLNMNESPRSKLSESFSERSPNKKDYVSNEDDDSLFVGKKKLFSQNTTNSFDLSDAFEFCSGKFPDASNAGTQNMAEANLDEEADISDYDEDVEAGDELDEEDDEDDDDGGDDGNDEDQNSTEEVSQGQEFPKDGQKMRKNIIAFEDSEEEEEEEEGERKIEEKQPEVEEPHPISLGFFSEDEDEAISRNNEFKMNKRNRKSLHFSDEEDEASDHEGEDDGEDEGVGNETADSDSEKEDDEEEEVRSIQYDSEENEIINPKEFFEKEAELSGSEWSGDEDERGLDEFDAEEGDADNLDSNEVRSQLEKIHIRRVLDDDAKEVRLIQEILFEDGDLHSDGKRRDRKFKWKHLGTFEEQENNDGAAEEGEISSDDCAEEEKQRKLRYEKELFLMTKNNGDVSSDEEITGDFQMVKLARVKAFSGSSTDRSKTVMSYTEIEKNTLISKTRGSFLARNDEFLSRLAKATASVTNSLSGPKNSRNFVFATKSPDKNAEKNPTCKRQVEETENYGRLEKRIKILPPEVDTGPSILDFLV